MEILLYNYNWNPWTLTHIWAHRLNPVHHRWRRTRTLLKVFLTQSCESLLCDHNQAWKVSHRCLHHPSHFLSTHHHGFEPVPVSLWVVFPLHQWPSLKIKLNYLQSIFFFMAFSNNDYINELVGEILYELKYLTFALFYCIILVSIQYFYELFSVLLSLKSSPLACYLYIMLFKIN